MYTIRTVARCVSITLLILVSVAMLVFFGETFKNLTVKRWNNDHGYSEPIVSGQKTKRGESVALLELPWNPQSTAVDISSPSDSPATLEDAATSAIENVPEAAVVYVTTTFLGFKNTILQTLEVKAATQLTSVDVRGEVGVLTTVQQQIGSALTSSLPFEDAATVVSAAQKPDDISSRLASVISVPTVVVNGVINDVDSVLTRSGNIPSSVVKQFVGDVSALAVITGSPDLAVNPIFVDISSILEDASGLVPSLAIDQAIGDISSLLATILGTLTARTDLASISGSSALATFTIVSSSPTIDLSTATSTHVDDAPTVAVSRSVSSSADGIALMLTSTSLHSAASSSFGAATGVFGGVRYTVLPNYPGTQAEASMSVTSTSVATLPCGCSLLSAASCPYHPASPGTATSLSLGSICSPYMIATYCGYYPFGNVKEISTSTVTVKETYFSQLISCTATVTSTLLALAATQPPVNVTITAECVSSNSRASNALTVVTSTLSAASVTSTENQNCLLKLSSGSKIDCFSSNLTSEITAMSTAPSISPLVSSSLPSTQPPSSVPVLSPTLSALSSTTKLSTLSLTATTIAPSQLPTFIIPLSSSSPSANNGFSHSETFSILESTPSASILASSTVLSSPAATIPSSSSLSGRISSSTISAMVTNAAPEISVILSEIAGAVNSLVKDASAVVGGNFFSSIVSEATSIIAAVATPAVGEAGAIATQAVGDLASLAAQVTSVVGIVPSEVVGEKGIQVVSSALDHISGLFGVLNSILAKPSAVLGGLDGIFAENAVLSSQTLTFVSSSDIATRTASPHPSMAISVNAARELSVVDNGSTDFTRAVASDTAITHATKVVSDITIVVRGKPTVLGGYIDDYGVHLGLGGIEGLVQRGIAGQSKVVRRNAQFNTLTDQLNFAETGSSTVTKTIYSTIDITKTSTITKRISFLSSLSTRSPDLTIITMQKSKAPVASAHTLSAPTVPRKRLRVQQKREVSALEDTWISCQQTPHDDACLSLEEGEEESSGLDRHI